MNPQQELENEQKKFELLESRLTDVQKNKLYALNQDEISMEALERALLYALYGMGTITSTDGKIHEVNWAFAIGYNTNTTDEQVGKALRVKCDALSLISDAFKQIKKFKEQKPTMTVEANPAL